MLVLHYAPDVLVPILLIQTVEDFMTDIDHVHDVYSAFKEPKEAIWIEGEMQRFHTYN